MSLGITRGEIVLVAFIFALVYLSGLLPKIAARLAGDPKKEPKREPKEAPETEKKETIAKAETE